MTRYHVNNETGEFGPCAASIQCPFKENATHVDTPKEAQQISEKIMTEKYTTEALKKNTKKNDKHNSSAMFNNELYRNVKKMPALFVIDRQANETTQQINESARWIFEEESRPTYKRDGTSITIDENGKIWARRSVKKGKTAPENYIEAEVDPITGHSFGLEPIEQSSFKKFFDEAYADIDEKLEPGSYELVGERINKNPENIDKGHKLMKHGEDLAEEIPDMRNVPEEEAFDMLKNIFTDYKERGIEGVVWWGKNGKRTKLRVKDFFGDPHRK